MDGGRRARSVAGEGVGAMCMCGEGLGGVAHGQQFVRSVEVSAIASRRFPHESARRR